MTGEFLASAEVDINRILLSQRLAFNERWQSSSLATHYKPILRKLALFLSVLGFFLSALLLVLGIKWCDSAATPVVMLMAFLLLGIFSYYLDAFDPRIKQWTKKVSIKNCRKRAFKCVADAKLQAPFTAQYHIKGGAISYYREKNGDSKQVWNRVLSGIAIQSAHATAIFKSAKTIVPTIVILHVDRREIELALIEQGVECRLVAEDNS